MSTTDVLSPAPPSGLPHVTALARLANEFFAALPGRSAAGGVPVPANPQPAGVSLPPGIAGPSTPAALPPGAAPGANLAPTSRRPPPTRSLPRRHSCRMRKRRTASPITRSSQRPGMTGVPAAMCWACPRLTQCRCRPTTASSRGRSVCLAKTHCARCSPASRSRRCCRRHRPPRRRRTTSSRRTRRRRSRHRPTRRST